MHITDLSAIATHTTQLDIATIVITLVCYLKDDCQILVPMCSHIFIKLFIQFLQIEHCVFMHANFLHSDERVWNKYNNLKGSKCSKLENWV